jgi:cytochrome c553
MKSVRKLLLYAIVFIVLIFAGLLSYITLLMPHVGKAEPVKITLTPKRIARGEYLANHVCLCMDCHSQRDWSKPARAIDPGHFGSGGYSLDESDGYPGQVYVPNITPEKLANWTDGEILRALTAGVRKDGTAIYPLMPWPAFAKMSREDLYAVIAYLRTLKPIKTGVFPPRKLKFPLNIWVNTLPQRTKLGASPNLADTVKYGAYLINMTSCTFCHASEKNGEKIERMAYAGGQEFNMGTKIIYSANITPDKATGIGNWTAEAFVGRFKSFTDSAKKVDGPGSPGPDPMPWYDYSGMTQTDLKAIYAYLKSTKPIYHKLPNN